MAFRSTVIVHYFILGVHLDFVSPLQAVRILPCCPLHQFWCFFFFPAADMSNQGDWLEWWCLPVRLVPLHSQLPVLPHDTDHFLAEGRKCTHHSEVSSLPASTKILQKAKWASLPRAKLLLSEVCLEQNSKTMSLSTVWRVSSEVPSCVTRLLNFWEGSASGLFDFNLSSLCRRDWKQRFLCDLGWEFFF